jgi:hypothetical protein
MSNLEAAKKRLELNKVKCAKEEMEVRVLEREAEIDRLKKSIAVQDEKILELEKDIN